jgi:hypothetical protein
MLVEIIKNPWIICQNLLHGQHWKSPTWFSNNEILIKYFEKINYIKTYSLKNHLNVKF